MRWNTNSVPGEFGKDNRQTRQLRSQTIFQTVVADCPAIHTGSRFPRGIRFEDLSKFGRATTLNGSSDLLCPFRSGKLVVETEGAEAFETRVLKNLTRWNASEPGRRNARHQVRWSR